MSAIWSRVVSRPISGMIDDPRAASNLPNFTVKLNESSRSGRTSPELGVQATPSEQTKISTVIEQVAILFICARLILHCHSP